MNLTYSRSDVESTFGPAAPGPGRFDFTLLFEETFLSIVPSVFLLLALPVRICFLRRRSRKVKKNPLYENKLLFLAVYAVMQTVLLVLQTTTSPRTKATVAAAVLSLVDALGLIILSNLEHKKSIRPSAIINVYLLLTLPFDVAHSRSLFLDGATKTAAVFTSALGIKVMILVAEAIEKRNILLDQYRDYSPETTSGIYSRSFFFWLNNLMTSGFRRIITNEDLYPIDEHMASRNLLEKGQRVWHTTNQEKSHALVKAAFKSNWLAFTYCIFPRLCVTGFRYAQPFLLSRTVKFAENPTEGDNVGWGLTGAFALTFLGVAISNAFYYHLSYQFITSIRGTLVGLIYSKTIDLSITALGESEAVTLMSSDTGTTIEAICQSLIFVHELWAFPIDLAIALYLLYLQLGLTFLATAATAILSAAGVLIVAARMNDAQKVWIQGIQRRVGVTASMLSNMKPVKMLGFTPLFNKIIQDLRATELSLSTVFRKLLVVRVLLGNTIPSIAPFLTFAGFVISSKISGSTLSISNAYTALSLITLLNEPFNALINTFPMLIASLACFKRIEDFLKSEARRDHRLPLTGPAETSSPLKVMPEGIELTEISESKHLSRHESVLLSAHNSSFAWEITGKPVQNILGVSAFEEPFYSEVVRACGLEPDIEIFPRGHATPVGSAGISLSGGQKQRLALARAVYARKELIILDDVFSGLDAETEEYIFVSLLGEDGLLRRSGTTVLLATHAVSRLRYADHIIAMDLTGRISEQGSYEELNDGGGYVQGLRSKLKVESSSPTSENPVKGLPNNKKVTATLEDDEFEVRTSELNRQSGDLAVYKHYLKSIGWLSVSRFFASVLLFGAGTKFTEFLLNYWTNAISKKGNSVNGFYIGLYGMLALLGNIGLLGALLEMALNMIPRSANILHAELLSTVMAAPLAFFTSTDTGSITNRFSQDMTILDAELPFAFINLACGLITTILSALLMCFSAGYFAAILPPVTLIVWVLQKYYLRTSRQVRLLDLEAKSPLYSHFIESLSGLATIRAFGWQNEFLERNLTLLDYSQKPYYLLFCIQRWLALVLDLLVMVLSVVLMILVVKLRHGINPGFVGLALLNVMSFNETLAYIVTSWTKLETSLGAIARLINFSQTTPSEHRPGEDHQVPDNWPFAGVIEFSNVSASYTSDDNLAIKNLNLSIKAGEKIGICGRSGSGKSSLITTLFRMLEVTADSSITIDGFDITKLPREIVRSRLNAIPQDPCFITGTVRENLDPLQLHSDSLVMSALEKVHLWDLVLSKGGLEVILDADFFSHGQRQLFCLARAILRRSRIIILDECTSSVDTKSDELMQRVIRSEFGDCTILAVAHRLDTILDFDKIALLSNGELKEIDTPAALLARDSAFRELYNS